MSVFACTPPISQEEVEARPSLLFSAVLQSVTSESQARSLDKIAAGLDPVAQSKTKGNLSTRRDLASKALEDADRLLKKKRASRDSSDTSKAVTTDAGAQSQTACRYCGKRFEKMGLGSHESACETIHVVEQLANAVNSQGREELSQAKEKTLSLRMENKYLAQRISKAKEALCGMESDAFDSAWVISRWCGRCAVIPYIPMRNIDDPAWICKTSPRRPYLSGKHPRPHRTNSLTSSVNESQTCSRCFDRIAFVFSFRCSCQIWYVLSWESQERRDRLGSSKEKLFSVRKS